MRYGRVLPVRPGEKKPALRRAKPGATRSVDQITKWMDTKPGCGWAFRIDHRRLIVLDLENESRGDGAATIRRLAEERGPLPSGPVVETASGGRHLYFLLPENFTGTIKNWTAVLPGIDIRVNKGMLMLPPTRLPNGEYRWLVPLTEQDPPLIPEWLLDALLEARAARNSGGGDGTPRSKCDRPVRQLAEERSSLTTVREMTSRLFGNNRLLSGRRPQLHKPLNRKLFLMRRDPKFQKTWKKTRSDFRRADGEPDKSKYELAIAGRALSCGCSASETDTLIRYWYTEHSLDSAKLSRSRMTCTINTALASTAAYRAEWEAKQSKRKPKLRSVILEFAAGRVSFSGNQILRSFDGPSDRPSDGSMRQMLSVLTQEGLMRRVSRGRYAPVAAEPAVMSVSRVHAIAGAGKPAGELDCADYAGWESMGQAKAA
jgi:hypothetical protein